MSSCSFVALKIQECLKNAEGSIPDQRQSEMLKAVGFYKTSIYGKHILHSNESTIRSIHCLSL